MNPENSSTLNISDTLTISWRHFTKQWGPWVASTAIVYVPSFILYIGLYVAEMVYLTAVPSATNSSGEILLPSEAPNPTIVTVSFVVGFVIAGAMWILYIVHTLNCYRNAYRQVMGEQLTLGDFFNFYGLGKLIAVSIISGALVFVGLCMCILPGLILAVALMYLPIAAVEDPRAPIGEIFSRAYQAFKDNITNSILLILLTMALAFGANMVTFGFGVLISVPLMCLMMTIGYLMCSRKTFMVPNS